MEACGGSRGGRAIERARAGGGASPAPRAESLERRHAAPRAPSLEARRYAGAGCGRGRAGQLRPHSGSFTRGKRGEAAREAGSKACPRSRPLSGPDTYPAGGAAE